MTSASTSTPIATPTAILTGGPSDSGAVSVSASVSGGARIHTSSSSTSTPMVQTAIPSLPAMNARRMQSVKASAATNVSISNSNRLNRNVNVTEKKSNSSQSNGHFQTLNVEKVTDIDADAGMGMNMNMDMDILAIPDPPTPDERNHAKTAAAALALRKRRKSRRLSGSIGGRNNAPPRPFSSTGDSHSNGVFSSTSGDKTAGSKSASASSPARARTVTIESQLRDAGLLSSNQNQARTTTRIATVTRVVTSSIRQEGTTRTRSGNDERNANARSEENDINNIGITSTHDNSNATRTSEMDTSNMDWAEGDSMDLGNQGDSRGHIINDHEEDEEVISGTPQSDTHVHAQHKLRPQGQSICFDDSDDEVFLAPLKQTQEHEQEHTNDENDPDAMVSKDGRAVYSSGKKRPRRGNGSRQSMLIPDQDDLQNMGSGLMSSDNIEAEDVDNGTRTAVATGSTVDTFDDRETEEMASPLKRARRGRKRSGRKSVILSSESGFDLKSDRIGNRHGRKSILLPSEMSENYEGNSNSTKDAKVPFVSLQQQGEAEADEPITNSSNARSPVRILDNSDKMHEIKAAIRKYCSLSLNERYKSDEAIRVEELTGYPLISSMDKINRKEMEKGSITSPIRLNWASSQSSSMSPASLVKLSNDMKRNLFEKIRPLVQIMEKKKKEDIAFLEGATGCRVERKRSKFRYVSLTTGKKVSAREYERRYLFKIQEQRDVKVLEMEQKVQANAEVKAKSVGDVLAPTIASDEEEKTQTLCTTEKSQNGSAIKSSPGKSKAANNKETFEDWLPDCDENAFDIPSKEEIRSDPELAEAEHKMHEAFNRAAEEYSRSVQRIRAKRKLHIQQIPK